MPIGRSDAKAAHLFVDGHVDARYPHELDDMRLWIDAADSTRYRWVPQ